MGKEMEQVKGKRRKKRKRENGTGKVKYKEDQEERTEIQTWEFLDLLQNAEQTQPRH